jgi:hypothetical protein
MVPRSVSAITEAIAAATGIIAVIGPAGSGKLYASLEALKMLDPLGIPLLLWGDNTPVEPPLGTLVMVDASTRPSSLDLAVTRLWDSHRLLVVFEGRDVHDLARHLRDIGWGQGEIDSMIEAVVIMPDQGADLDRRR